MMLFRQIILLIYNRIIIGDNMKNTLIICLLFLITGLLIGNNLYNKIDLSLLPTFNEQNKYYLLQQGVYNSKESMQSETKNINPKVVFFKDDKYYVYVGITSKEENAKKIKDIYENQGIDIYLRETTIKDEEFINNITQFDILIENTNNEEEILTIEEVVLSSYGKKLENN